MRVLLDESLPRQLALKLPEHEVETVQRKGWSATKSGRLLGLAADSAFEVLLTGDRNIEHQQNVSKHRIGVVVVAAKSNRMEDLLPLVQEIQRAIETVKPGQLVTVGQVTGRL